MLDQYLNTLAKELSLVASPLDENKTRQLTLGNVYISIKELESGFYLFAPIIETPQEKKEELLTLLMKANFLGQGTGGGIVGMSDDESHLTLSLDLTYEISYKKFKEALEDFANYVDYWRQEISRHPFETAGK